MLVQPNRAARIEIRFPISSTPSRPSDQKRQLAPLPVAIDVAESYGTEPLQLGVNIKQLVGRVFVSRGNSHRFEKALMTVRRCRRDVLEIAEDATWCEKSPDFSVQLSLSFVREVMNRETRDDKVERPERR